MGKLIRTLVRCVLIVVALEGLSFLALGAIALRKGHLATYFSALLPHPAISRRAAQLAPGMSYLGVQAGLVGYGGGSAPRGGFNGTRSSITTERCIRAAGGCCGIGPPFTQTSWGSMSSAVRSLKQGEVPPILRFSPIFRSTSRPRSKIAMRSMSSMRGLGRVYVDPRTRPPDDEDPALWQPPLRDCLGWVQRLDWNGLQSPE